MALEFVGSMFHKSRIYPVVLIIILFVVWKVRQNDKPEKVTIMGETMGTTYSIIYLDVDGTNFKDAIDSLLQVWNMSLSTYIPESEISVFNRTNELTFNSPYFLPVLKKSREIFEATHGAFDPTVMPLVNAWGFGPETEDLPDSAEIKNLLDLVDYNNIVFDSLKVWKKKPGVQLDFSAIAKGYGVDVVAAYLHEQGIENYLVEIGGEIVCRGVNDRGTPWTTGIEDPSTDFLERKMKAIIEVSDKAIATSGNYRNFYVRDGKRYAHTISPFTGFPIEHTILSATVIADDCMTADAYATAFMVLGVDEGEQLLLDHPELEAYFIYSADSNKVRTWSTEGFVAMLKKENQ